MNHQENLNTMSDPKINSEGDFLTLADVESTRPDLSHPAAGDTLAQNTAVPGSTLLECNHREKSSAFVEPDQASVVSPEHVSPSSTKISSQEHVSPSSTQVGSQAHVSPSSTQVGSQAHVSPSSTQVGSQKHVSPSSTQVGSPEHVSPSSTQVGSQAHVSPSSTQVGSQKHVSPASTQVSSQEHVSLSSTQASSQKNVSPSSIPVSSEAHVSPSSTQVGSPEHVSPSSTQASSQEHVSALSTQVGSPEHVSPSSTQASSPEHVSPSSTQASSPEHVSPSSTQVSSQAHVSPSSTQVSSKSADIFVTTASKCDILKLGVMDGNSPDKLKLVPPETEYINYCDITLSKDTSSPALQRQIQPSVEKGNTKEEDNFSVRSNNAIEGKPAQEISKSLQVKDAQIGEGTKPLNEANVTKNVKKKRKEKAVYKTDDFCIIGQTPIPSLSQNQSKGMSDLTPTQPLLVAALSFPEPTPASHREFQPIILNVKGTYSEAEESQVRDTTNQLPTITGTDAQARNESSSMDIQESTTSMPISAYALLQAIVGQKDSNALNSSSSPPQVKTTSKAGGASVSKRNISAPHLSPEKTTNDQEQSNGSRKDRLSSGAEDSINKQFTKKKLKIASSKDMMRKMIELKQSPIETSTAAGSTKQGSVSKQLGDFPVVQAALSGPANPDLTILGKCPDRVSAPQPGSPHVRHKKDNKQRPTLDIISQLVADTVNSFSLKGKDLTSSDLLKVADPSLEEVSGQSDSVVRCLACSQEYYDEEGLNFHLDRTVFHLMFHCSYCAQVLVFYNKCTLWKHIKQESVCPTLNFTNILSLKPYEFDTEVDQQNDLVKASAQQDSVAAVSAATLETSSGHQQEKVTQQEESVERFKSLSSQSDSGQQQQLTCVICSRAFSNISEHLCPPTAREIHRCHVCSMCLPSACARTAHVKIHSATEVDMLCPECGQHTLKKGQEREDLQTVFDHLDNCNHFNRVLSLICFCSQECLGVRQAEAHFVKKHFCTLFKCPHCVLAFTQQGHLLGHLDKFHQNASSESEASVLCLHCQQILKSSAELQQHLDMHIEKLKQEAVYKWKCFICAKSYTDKGALSKHLKLDHPHRTKRCAICYSLFWNRNNLVEHIVKKKCSRSLVQDLNRCVDVQPENSGYDETIDLAGLFEVKKVAEPGSKTAKGKSHLGSFLVNKISLIRNGPGSSPNQSAQAKPSSVSTSSQNVTTSVKKTGQLSQVNERNLFNKTNSLPLRKIFPKRSVSSSDILRFSTSLLQPVIAVAKKSIEPQADVNCSIDSQSVACVVCDQSIDTAKLTDHLKFHQSEGVIICIHCQKRDFPNVEEALRHSELCGNANESSSQRNSSGLGNSLATDNENNTTTVNQELSEKTQTDEGKGQNTDSQPPTPPPPPPPQPTVYPCFLCGLAFQTIFAREQHISRSHDGTRMVYHCSVCRKKGLSKSFVKKDLVAKHITRKHRVVNLDAVNRLIWTEEQNISSGQKLPLFEPATPGDPDPDDGPTPKRLRLAGQGDYMCGKCGFSCSGADEFSHHIFSHNATEEPQCPECGLCFTIVPALKKHLLAVHKIKSVDDYMKVHLIAEPELEEEEVEPDLIPEVYPFSQILHKPFNEISDKSAPAAKVAIPANPLECNVCYKIFDNETNLKTHMRNHGMAFIRSKRHKL